VPSRATYSDAAIVIGLRVKSVERGRQTGSRGMVPITAAWWDLYRDKSVHPPSPTVIRRFGSWTRACERAGVPTRDFVAPPGRVQKWTDEEILDAVREFLTNPRRKETSHAAYDAWSRLRKARPSGATVLLRFGNWGTARQKALQ
jgi:hypothetical protein